MKQPYYEFSVDSECIRFDFVSLGKAVIRKQIQFEHIGNPHLYNLALGDLKESGEFDASIKSNNGDMDKVLATTIQVINYFFDINPNAIIYVEGNTPSRTRLYQIIISREFDLLSEQFTVFGRTMDDIEAFKANKAYEGFVIILKK